MESDRLYGFVTNTMFVFTVLIGVSVFILIYFIKMFKNEEVSEKTKNERSTVYKEKKKEPPQSGKRKKKIIESKWSGKHEKHSYNHPWLLVSLKGHTGNILDMDFSSNGKYLASCDDEDPDPGGKEATCSASPIDVAKRSVFGTSANQKGLSRRQRKNRKREDSSPSERQKSKKTKTRKMLKQFKMLKIDDETFFEHASRFCLRKREMEAMGYPRTSDFNINKVIVYKSPRVQSRAINKTVYNVKTMEEYKNDLEDSGHGSGDSDSSFDDGESSSSSGSSSSSSGCSAHTTFPDSGPKARRECQPKTCSRCFKEFIVSPYGYISKDKCQYHWGRLQYVHQPNNNVAVAVFTCCKRAPESQGCSVGQVHVWSGFDNGHNLFERTEFVETESSASYSPKKCQGVYAIDCEMCYTVRGLELTKVTVVGMDGRIVYNTYVRPVSQIVDYNTRFSGISEKTLQSHPTKTLKQVQCDLLTFINAETILIGHGLENDLFALRLLHKTVIDTAQLFPHFHGLPYRRSLKNLMSSILKREIQTGDAGHNSYEDASACMELILWKVMKHL